MRRNERQGNSVQWDHCDCLFGAPDPRPHGQIGAMVERPRRLAVTSQDPSRPNAALARDHVNVDLKTVELWAPTRATVGAIRVSLDGAVQGAPRLQGRVAGGRP